MIPIYTIGYGKRTFEEFVTVLQQYQISFLVDVRSAPYSRFKPEYNKDTLSAHLAPYQIRYAFLGEQLGGRPNDLACYTDGKVDYAKVQQKVFFQTGIGRIQKAFAQQIRVALMCSEGKPEACHRSKLIGETLDALGIPVEHIDDDDQLVSQTTVIARITNGQMTLFDDPMFTSRKRYQLGDNDESE